MEMKNLDKIDKEKYKQNFEVPEGYFDDFEAKLLDSISKEEKQPEVKVIPMWKKTMFWTGGIAASLLLLILLLNLSKQDSIPASANVSLTNVDNGELMDYFQDHFSDPDMEELALMVDFSNIDLENFSDEIQLEEAISIEEELLIDYQWINEYE